MSQDQGTQSPEAGRTWPNWKVLETGTGEMTTVRSDSVGFQNSAMRLGTLFRRADGTLWEFALHTPGDLLQGGTMFQLKLVREA